MHHDNKIGTQRFTASRLGRNTFGRVVDVGTVDGNDERGDNENGEWAYWCFFRDEMVIDDMRWERLRR